MSSKWETNGGLYLGIVPAREEPSKGATDEPENLVSGVWRPAGDRPETHDYILERHAMLLAPNGAGKSWRVLLPNLCRLVGWSMVVIDPKGELAAHTAKHRKDKGQRVMVLDPFKIMETAYPRLLARPEFAFLKSHGFNPLAALDPTRPSFVDDAKRLADALIRRGGHKETYWTDSARALCKGLLMACRTKYPKTANLSMIRALLGSDPKKLTVWNADRIAELGKAHPAIAATHNRFTHFTPEDREFKSILSTAMTETDWLDSPMIAADLNGGADAAGDQFDFARLKQEPTTVFLVLPPEYLETHGAWLRVIVNAILLPLLRSTEDAPVPILLALDEYAALGNMDVIERNMAMMRGYGVKLWPILQDLSQLKDVHPDRWESFLGNAGVRMIFAPQDYTTQEYFSKLSGQRVWTYHTQSSSTSATVAQGVSVGDTSGLSEAKTMVPRFAPDHLGEIRRGQALLFIAETRSGVANVRARSILPDPRSREAQTLIPDVAFVVDQARRAIEA